MQSKFDIIADLGNFRFSVQCLKCGHDFTHRSGQENSFTISEGKTTPVCPICGAKDDGAADDKQEVLSNTEALAAFGITLVENIEPNQEPWKVYDSKMRESMSRRQDECIAEGKRWIEQDISSNDYDGTLNEKQIAAIKYLFPVKGPELLAFCRAK
jgi:hypothetical protein